MSERVVPGFARVSQIAALALVAIGCVAILSTARVFSGTVDEPAHLAAGLQWLSTGQYDYDLQHPPLGRIAGALGPFLRGARTTGAPGVFDEGARILGSGTHYEQTLAIARHGEIVFYLLLAAVVWAWARHLTNDAGAAVATLLVVANPNISAHAGLVTTDIACAATTTLALYIAVRWATRATWWRTIAFGAAVGAAVSGRLSAIGFVGAALAVCYAVRWWSTGTWKLAGLRDASQTIAKLATALFTFCLVVWGAYRFAVGPLHAGGISLPAPAFLEGVRIFLLHGGSGHPTFLLGTPGNRGWWYYFPVALLVKTPLPILLCAILGVACIGRRLRRTGDWSAAVPLCSAAAIVALSMTVHVDLGVRLVLPVYPLLAVVGAVGVSDLWRERPERAARGALAAVLAAAAFVGIVAYPDNLSYFNALAGSHPERILVDSNLDWGQGLYRLRDTIAARGINDTVRVAYFGTTELTAAGVPRARILGLHERATGWIAASETYLAGEWVGGAYAWLLDYPTVARIGPSMRLWYIPAPAHPTTDSLQR